MDISPDKQNIDTLFATTPYYIDFYQRDYKWTKEPVARLLDDIFYQFQEKYSAKSELEASPETVSNHYPWYYLNTYVTNKIGSKVFVVDGQQRLTTITLILIALFHRSKHFGSIRERWIETKILGHSSNGYEFWMRHERHIDTLQGLFDGADEPPVDSGITAENMVSNYAFIAGYLDGKLKCKHQFDTFVLYFLNRLVLINLIVEQTDVPMVFEVINDRGVRLRPYEILKGKLLGQIDKDELTSLGLNETWEDCVYRLNSRKPEEIDTFFIYYLKAKFADTRGTAIRFDNDYHREIFKTEVDCVLKLERNATGVKSFIQNEVEYFTGLYARVMDLGSEFTPGFEAVFYNRLNEMDTQFQLIMSACTVNDMQEDEKIQLIARNIDKLFTYLRLQRIYDSNEFTIAVHDLGAKIREKEIGEIQKVFDDKFLEMVKAKRGSEATGEFTYAQFKSTSVSDIPARFTRYFFARIEKFIATGMKREMPHALEDLVLKTGTVNGFHIEHILSRNEQNRSMYDDKDEFEAERNRLGGILLLKGRDNISSNNEDFSSKLESYANSLCWNETLRSDTYKSKKDFTDFLATEELPLKALDVFGPNELEERQKLLFLIARKLWG